YSPAEIKAMVEKQEESYGWEFIFLGANIDAIVTAGSMGIRADRALDYLADGKGTALNYKILSETIGTFRTTGRVDQEGLNEIRRDARERGN
ncbi:MAG: hypothetical protein GX819_06285, partial [Clostridiaceae bacterium]|nr:hypothetical protein [Clostridiaceae bacterium]